MEARREGKDAAAKIRTRRFQRAPDGRKVFQFLFLLLSLIYFSLHLIIYTLLPCPITICFIFCLCQGRKGAVRCSTGGGDMRNVKRQSLEIGYLQKQEIQGECHKQKGLIKAITRPGNREPFSFTRHRSGQHPKWPTTTNDRVSFRSICPLFETLLSLSNVVSVISDQLHMVRVILNGWNTCAMCSGKSRWKIIQSGSEKSWNMAKAHFLWMEPKSYCYHGVLPKITLV